MLALTGLGGGLVYVAKDNKGVRAFVAMSKAIIMQDTSIFEHSEPPPIFGSDKADAGETQAAGGKNSARYERNAGLLDSIFGEMKPAPEPPRVRGQSSGGGGSFSDRAFGRTPDKSGTFVPSRVSEGEEGKADSVGGAMPRDFTERGRQQSNVRRIRIEE